MLSDRFSTDDVLLDATARNKGGLLELLAEAAAKRVAGPRDAILDALQAREDLGSTALGKGMAMPHALLGEGGSLMLFARLRRPIDFDARDSEPVDLFFFILWPSTDPKGLLKAMADVTRVLRAPEVLHRLRAAQNPEEVVEILSHSEPDAGDHA